MRNKVVTTAGKQKISSSKLADLAGIRRTQTMQSFFNRKGNLMFHHLENVCKILNLNLFDDWRTKGKPENLSIIIWEKHGLTGVAKFVEGKFFALIAEGWCTKPIQIYKWRYIK